jgi:SAM-dependent methyltransferase
MSQPLDAALARVRDLLLDSDRLASAVASGRRRGAQPRWRRVTLRYVDLRAGRHLQVTAYDATQAHTANHPVGKKAAEQVDALLAEPFGNWHVETTDRVHQLRVTKKLAAVVHTRARDDQVAVERGHDRDKPRLLTPDDPVLVALGISTAEGRLKPSRQAKYRQVEEFVRLLDLAITESLAKGHLRTPSAGDPLRVVDLGCGNAYLTFAAHRFLTGVRGLPVRFTGVDTKQQSRDHNAAIAASLGIDADFVVGSIAEARLDPAPEVVLALHACDTATDDALARAVRWRSPLVLAAPCCHHDVAAQLRSHPAPAPYGELVRHGILRERFADTLTDALRAGLLRGSGYRVDVVEFVESAHTPRNTLLRAVRTGAAPDPTALSEYDALVRTWQLRPRLGELLGHAPA